MDFWIDCLQETHVSILFPRVTPLQQRVKQSNLTKANFFVLIQGMNTQGKRCCFFFDHYDQQEKQKQVVVVEGYKNRRGGQWRTTSPYQYTSFFFSREKRFGVEKSPAHRQGVTQEKVVGNVGFSIYSFWKACITDEVLPTTCPRLFWIPTRNSVESNLNPLFVRHQRRQQQGSLFEKNKDTLRNSQTEAETREDFNCMYLW